MQFFRTNVKFCDLFRRGITGQSFTAVLLILYEKELGKTWEDIQNEIEEEEDGNSNNDKSGDEE